MTGFQYCSLNSALLVRLSQKDCRQKKQKKKHFISDEKQQCLSDVCQYFLHGHAPWKTSSPTCIVMLFLLILFAFLKSAWV